MWIDTTRAQHARKGLRLPSDLTDAEWRVLEPVMLTATQVGLAQASRRDVLPAASRSAVAHAAAGTVPADVDDTTLVLCLA